MRPSEWREAMQDKPIQRGGAAATGGCCGPEGAHGAGTAQGCCTPAGAHAQTASGAAPALQPASPSAREALLAETVLIPGGRGEVGTMQPLIAADGEGPRRTVRLTPFRLGVTAVTNAQFSAFIAETGYLTEAERFGWSYVFYQHVHGAAETDGVVGAEWWRRIEGACWKAPFGPGSRLEGRAEYPVVHVSWNDAAAFAAWAGGRLPGEAEWEHAARGGRASAIYPWGDRHPDDESFMPCNIWQGEFPRRNTAADGYAGLAPARTFAPNGYGLYNMCGNTWEWTAETFRVRSLKAAARAADAHAREAGFKLLKGGSHLCHRSYCHRYRIAARTGNTPDSTTGHMGFRVAFDA
jgi:formylglycine-generating enzyme required for sulfatase activity